MSFQNWLKVFDKFWPEHSKGSKMFTLIGSFWAMYILFELQKYRGIIFHETEEGYKSWSGIGCRFKIDIRNLKNVDLSTKVSKMFTLIGSFWAKYILFELKKYRGVIFHETEEGYKIWRVIDLPLQNWQRNLTNFDLSTWNSQKSSL